MKSTVEQLSPTRVRINVEVPFDELKPNFDRAYRKLAQQARIPGFRPGKAPARILESRLGRGVVLDEVVNEAVPAKYSEAVTSGEVRALGRPDIEVTRIEDGDLLAFTAEVDIRPEMTLPAFGDIAVTVDDVEVSDADVADQLDVLRTRFGVLLDVERAARTGDFVVVDLSATVDGEPVEEAATTGMSYEVGSGQLIEGIDEVLAGMAAGESKTFPAPLVGGKHAGRTADVTVAVSAVKERELPEADDEFAEVASEFDTLDALRADIRERLVLAKRMRQSGQAREKVLQALLAGVEVPLPPAVVESAVEAHKHEVAQEFDHDEQRLDAFLAEQGRSREEFDAELRESAAEAVKTQLVLDAVADAEEIAVTEAEMTDRVIFQAARSGTRPEEFLRRVQEAGQLGTIYADVRRGKALATVIRAATVTDPAGDPVDFEELSGPAQPPVTEDAPVTGDAPAAGDAPVAGDVPAAAASGDGESEPTARAGTTQAGTEAPAPPPPEHKPEP